MTGYSFRTFEEFKETLKNIPGEEKRDWLLNMPECNFFVRDGQSGDTVLHVMALTGCLGKYSTGYSALGVLNHKGESVLGNLFLYLDVQSITERLRFFSSLPQKSLFVIAEMTGEFVDSGKISPSRETLQAMRWILWRDNDQDSQDISDEREEPDDEVMDDADIPF